MEDYNYSRDHSGQRATGIGLAAGLGGGALLLAFAGLWGLNQASKARSASAMALAGANAAALGTINSNLLAERSSREAWQSANQPTIKSYIDVQATPTAQSTSSALADAYAVATAINNNNLGAAIGHEAFVKVQRYSAPQPCGCDSCGA